MCSAGCLEQRNLLLQINLRAIKGSFTGGGEDEEVGYAVYMILSERSD